MRIGAEHRGFRDRDRRGLEWSIGRIPAAFCAVGPRVSEQVPGLDFDVAIDQHGRQFLGKHIERQNAAQSCSPARTRSRQFKSAAAAAP